MEKMEVVARVEAQSHGENSGCVTLNERGRGSNVICFERESANDAFSTPTIVRIPKFPDVSGHGWSV